MSFTTNREIRPIPEESKHRIVAGQAVTDLASAVKELVDNALDANSTNINIRLFNQGIDIVEVSDDGCGIPPGISRQLLATTPYATSKIQCLEDIYKDYHDDHHDADHESTMNAISSSSLSSSITDEQQQQQEPLQQQQISSLPASALPPSRPSFGFRGEALFSLAVLSNCIVVATRTQSEIMAEKMEINHHGIVGLIETISRKVGTTVAVVRLFESLPVRRADFIRRISNQRIRLIKILEGYAIFSIGVRIHLMDMIGSHCQEQSILMTTLHNTSLEENISSIMGSKFLATLAPIHMDLPFFRDHHSDTSTTSGPLQSNGASSTATSSSTCPWQIRGYVSKIGPLKSIRGGGGNNKCYQLYAINRRPVELPRVTRLLNEIWTKGFGPTTTATSTKKPSCFLSFTIPNSAIDINLSPDKREVLFTKYEIELYQSIRAGLLQFWSNQTDGQFVSTPIDIIHPSTTSFTTTTSLDDEDDDNVDVESDTNDDNTVDDNDDDLVSSINQDVSVRMDNGINGCPRAATTTPTAAVLANTSSGEQQQQEDDSPSGKFTRRYAFAHDFNKARLQHQFDDGRIKRKDSNSEVSDTKDISVRSEDQDHQSTPTMGASSQHEGSVQTIDLTADTNQLSSIRDADSIESDQNHTVNKNVVATQSSVDAASKRQRLTLDQTLTSLVPLDPSQVGITVTPSPIHALSTISCKPISTTESIDDPDTAEKQASRTTKEDDDNDISDWQSRRQWHRVQSTFNTHEGSPLQDEITLSINRNHAKKRDRPLPATRAQETECKQQLKQKQLNLDQFRFGAVRVNSKTLPSIANNIDINSSSIKPRDNESSEQPRAASLLPTQDSCSIQQGEHAAEKQQEHKGKEQQHCTDDKAHLNRTADEQSKMCWRSFKDTEEVIRLARRHRLALRDRKMETDAGRPHDLTEGDDEHKNSKDDQVGEIREQSADLTTVSLTKSDFAHMTVIGQFNMGFILAKSRDNHLWILDQHACDEKYNFEKLCKETMIHEQKLLIPMPIELSPIEETCVLDNMEIFEKNGFRFLYDANKPPRHRLSLTALPHSGAPDGRKAVQFGKEDVSALCAVLGADGDTTLDNIDGGGTGVDGSGIYGNNAVRRYAGLGGGVVSTHVKKDKNDTTSDTSIVARLPKAIAMLASRACRGSIMIGKALSAKEMEKVIQKMSHVQHPWTCAHGRPTMRHIGDLSPMLRQDDNKATAHLAGPTITVMTQDVAIENDSFE